MAWWVEYQAGLEEGLKSEFEAAFTQARLAVTTYKDEKERAWFGVAGTEKLKDKKWMVKHYQTAGAVIGPQRRLQRAMAKLGEVEGYVVITSGGGWQVSKEGAPVCTVRLYAAPEVEPPPGDGHHRAIHMIHGKEYVLDDAKIPTRRYAFCVRQKQGDAPVLKPLPNAKERPWKFNSTEPAWAKAMAAAVKAISQGRGEWHKLSVESKACLAYINYANDGKLGVCLSSTPKRIRDNPGESFAKQVGHTIWKVDLAKVPKQSVLINIYARDSPTEGWTAKKKERTRGGDWIAQGTVKNRELFCSNVPSESAVSMDISAALLEADRWSWKAEAWFCAAAPVVVADAVADVGDGDGDGDGDEGGGGDDGGD